jgi:hypothetical protein
LPPPVARSATLRPGSNLPPALARRRSRVPRRRVGR